jgi:hypothetical protein
MYKTISNEIIRKFHPCYDPSKVIKDETEELTVKQWVEKYRKVVPAKDILWLLLREEFLSEKDLILFAVWCVRESLKLIENPDERSVDACNVVERYANGEAATQEELLDARHAALNAAHNADFYVYQSAYYAAVYAANAAISDDNVAVHTAHAASYASDAANDVFYAFNAANDANDAHAAQLDQLLTYFE